MATNTVESGSNKQNKKCGKCRKNVTSNQKGLNCEYCSVWFHIECEEIGEEQYEFIRKQGEQLHWFCRGCNPKALDVMKLVQGLKDKHDELQCKIEQLENKVETIEEVRGKFRERVNDVVREEIYEAKERESRITNVIIKNLEEIEDDVIIEDDKDSDDETEEVETETGNGDDMVPKSDLDQVNHLLKDVLELNDVVVEEVKRVPERKIDGKKRMIIATMKDKAMRDRVLKSAKKLRQIRDWDHVYLAPDLTKRDREQDYQLRQELKHRRETGEKNLIIRRGKIITRDEEVNNQGRWTRSGFRGRNRQDPPLPRPGQQRQYQRSQTEPKQRSQSTRR